MVGFVGALDGEVTKGEIWSVVSSLGQNKAPGRDGVTASFFKFYWDIVGEQVLNACLEFLLLEIWMHIGRKQL